MYYIVEKQENTEWIKFTLMHHSAAEKLLGSMREIL